MTPLAKLSLLIVPGQWKNQTMWVANVYNVPFYLVQVVYKWLERKQLLYFVSHLYSYVCHSLPAFVISLWLHPYVFRNVHIWLILKGESYCAGILLSARSYFKQMPSISFYLTSAPPQVLLTIALDCHALEFSFHLSW